MSDESSDPNSLNEKLLEEEETKPPPPSWINIIFNAAIWGLWFGVAIGKGQTFQPQIIVEQMLMRKFLMMKMFLSAVATACLGMAVLSFLRPKDFEAVREKKLAGNRGLWATIAGGLLLGSGMAFSGSCPGTVWVQIGSGVVPGSCVTLAGGLVASFIWTFVKEPIENSRFFTSMGFSRKSVDGFLGVSFWIVSVGFAVMMAVGVFLFEFFFPYEKELAKFLELNPGTTTLSVFGHTAWPPYVAGIMVGLIPLITVPLLSISIGSSSGFSMITSLFLYPFIKGKNKFVDSRVSDRVNYFSPLYLVAAVGGGAIAALSSSSIATNVGLSPLLSFVGGFLLIFGSLLGGGCTSGHGIAGISCLSIPSCIAVAAMFGGGIPTAYILELTGAYLIGPFLFKLL
jgi:uncharacterized membrane protein YedE/YeeE